MMVDFVRDVIVAVAVLATLIAFAVHHSAESEPKRHGTGLGTAIAANITPAATEPAQTGIKQPVK
jgi:hypothetical protein